LEAWDEGALHVSDDEDSRIMCPHPLEHFFVAAVLGIDPEAIFGYPYMKILDPALDGLVTERTGTLKRKFDLWAYPPATF
jgi:hypothetical protein